MVIDLKALQKKVKELKSKKENKKSKSLYNNLSKSIHSKSVLKKSQATVTIKQREVPSVLNDPNRFFNQEMEEVKKTMFFR